MPDASLRKRIQTDKGFEIYQIAHRPAVEIHSIKDKENFVYYIKPYEELGRKQHAFIKSVKK